MKYRVKQKGARFAIEYKYANSDEWYLYSHGLFNSLDEAVGTIRKWQAAEAARLAGEMEAKVVWESE